MVLDFWTSVVRTYPIHLHLLYTFLEKEGGDQGGKMPHSQPRTTIFVDQARLDNCPNVYTLLISRIYFTYNQKFYGTSLTDLLRSM